jgi:lysozyme
MSTVRSRWLKKLNTARLWAAIALRRYKWHPTAENRRKLKERRAQVAAAERVLKRHPPHPAKQPARLIDVSNLQGAIDFKKVKRAGFDGVIVKAGEGDWLDPWFYRNVKTATAAGLHVGAYQYVSPIPGRTGRQEAERYFIPHLKAAGLGDGDIRPVLDVEKTKVGKAATHEYVHSFVEAMRDHGYAPIIYTGAWFYNPQVGDDGFGCPLWIAAYQDHEPALPRPWREYVMWQYTDKADVPGAGRVDADKCPDLHEVIA